MEEDYTMQKLLTLRKLTRMAGDIINGQTKEYIASLAPLFRPRGIFWERIQGSGKEIVKGSEQAFKELEALYENVATAASFFICPGN
jgi:hypothetical protein